MRASMVSTLLANRAASRSKQSVEPAMARQVDRDSQIEPARASQVDRGSQIEPARASQVDRGSQIEASRGSQVDAKISARQLGSSVSLVG